MLVDTSYWSGGDWWGNAGLGGKCRGKLGISSVFKAHLTVEAVSRVDGKLDGVLVILGPYADFGRGQAQKALRNVLGADFGALRGLSTAPM